MPILAFVVLSVVTMSARLSVDQNEREANQRSAEYARQGHEEAQFRCAVFISGPERSNCLHEIERTARENQRREYEIEADRDSAVWNEAMGEAAAVAGVIGIMTMILVFVTYEAQLFAAKHARRQFLHAREDAAHAAKAAERTIRAANKTAKASADQVKISQEAAYRQLRAYISIEDPKVTRITKSSVGGDLTIRNAGQTPATIELYLALWIGEFPALRMPGSAPHPLRFNFHGPYINAKSAAVVSWYYPLATLEPDKDGPTEIARAVADPVHVTLYLYGRIEFLDYKRHRRVLKYAFRNESALIMGNADKMIAAPWGNEYEDLDKEP